MYCDETVRRMVDELAMQNEIWREHEELWGEEGADLDDYTFDFDDEDIPEGTVEHEDTETENNAQNAENPDAQAEN